MKKFFVLVCCLLTFNSWAIENRANIGIGLATLEGESIGTLTLDYHFLFDRGLNLGPGDFKFGPGIRLTHLSSKQFPIYKDEVFLEDVVVTAANIAVYSEYQWKKMMAGFNIDLFGQSFGPDVDVKDSTDSTGPTRNNLLKGSKADKGTLTSELWVGYRFHPYLMRIGLAHMVTEYDGRNPDGRARQRFFNAFFVSGGWSF